MYTRCMQGVHQNTKQNHYLANKFPFYQQSPKNKQTNKQTNKESPDPHQTT